ncbi:MAG: multiple sugar transport system permease protein [Chloroflexota bacterium]|jgi:multiple sugar transport system permease protein|nr:multiple sugar transport system permease protein [Chloroflexota bacterium]
MNAQAAAQAVARTHPPRRRLTPPTRAERRNLSIGLLFISPWLVGFVCFYLYPALASFYYSFTDFKILQDPTFVGLDNYRRLLADPFFWKSLANTLYLTVFGVPLAIATALGIALLLNTPNVRGIGIFRTIFYLPVVVPSVAAAILWIWLLNPQYGLVNQFLSVVGIDGPKWFYDPEWSKNGIILMAVWAAGDVVIIYLGALQGVSRALYEAAEVDGAGPLAKLRHVTIPMISPAILFNLITGAIGAFQYFTQAYVVSEGTVGRGSGAVGGIQNSLLFYGLNLYNNAFRYFRIGYASALAWFLLLLILVTTVVLLRASRSRVYYEGER